MLVPKTMPKRVFIHGYADKSHPLPSLLLRGKFYFVYFTQYLLLNVIS
jgi:hypothetical protein